MTGARALASTSRIHRFHRPTATDILDRTASDVAKARIEFAAELLKGYGENTKVADWKVAYLGAAAWWFRWALAMLLLLATLLGAYGIWGPEPPPTS